ncbi:MAG: lipopolysaccharide heptosyltransferase II [Desulfobacteraceae bacterium]
MNMPGRGRVGRILVRAANWVGDVVMGLPALEALHAGFPESRITVLARPWVRALLENHPAVDEIMDLSKDGGPLRSLAEVLSVSFQVRKKGFDLAVLFQNAFEAAFIARLGGVPIRVGYGTDLRAPLLTHPVPKPDGLPGRHQVEYYLHLVGSGLGIQADGHEPRLFIGQEEIRRATRLLEEAGFTDDDFILGLAPGAAYGPAKRWPAERFAGAADRAASAWGARVAILGSGADRDACKQVESAMRQRPVNFCGGTGLGEAVGLIARCGLFLTNDSGLMHVSAALGVPTVAVFGSTDPEATGPRGGLCRVVRRKTPCSPCFKSVCPRDFSCMLGVTEDMVWTEMEALAGGLPAEPGKERDGA